MNPSVNNTRTIIESTLQGNKAFRKIEEDLYVIKQGSSIVMINVVEWDSDRAILRCVAQLVQGVQMKPELALQLLRLNSILRFGSFAYVDDGQLVVFLHSILGGEALQPEELLVIIRDIALIADEWDDKIISRFGGQRMQDLLETSAQKQIFKCNADSFVWEK